MLQRIHRHLSWFWAGRAVLLALALTLTLGGAVSAENLGPGGGTRIIFGDELVGPYRVLATVAPEPAQTGPLTFAVRVSDGVSGEKIRDAQVTLELRHSATGAVITAEATHAAANSPIDYVAHLPQVAEGVWNGTLRVTGPAGAAQASFTQRVVPARQLSTAIMIGIPFLVVLIGLAGFWVLRSRPAAEKR